MNNKNDRFFVPIELLTFASMNGWRYTLDITNDTIQIYNDTLDDVEGVYYLKVSNSEATWSLKDRCYRITYFISAPHFRREYSISAALKMEQGIDYEIHIIDARNEKESGTLRIRIDQEQRYYFTTIIVQDWKSNGVNINWLSHPKATNYIMTLNAKGLTSYKKTVTWTMTKTIESVNSTMMNCIIKPEEIAKAINNKNLEGITWVVEVSLEAYTHSDETR